MWQKEYQEVVRMKMVLSEGAWLWLSALKERREQAPALGSQILSAKHLSGARGKQDSL